MINYIKNWWWSIDRWVFSLTLILISIGILLILSSSSGIELRYNFANNYLITKHLLFLPIAIFIIFFFSTLSIRNLIIMSLIIFTFCLILSFIVLFLPNETKGAKRWLKLFQFTVQPSEFIKPAYVIISALLLSRFKKKSDMSFNINIILLSLISLALISQPDFGMFVLIFITWFSQIILLGVSIKIILFLIIFGGLVTMFSYIYHSHIRFRINNFFDKSLGDNYQTNLSLDALSSGGFFGKGIGTGTFSKKLPDAHSDFIFSIASEELGFVFSCLIIFIYLIIFYRVTINTLKIDNLFIFLATSGLSLIFIFQILINISSAMNLIPTKGMTLPFLSYGGSSLISCSIIIGSILSLTKKRTKF